MYGLHLRPKNNSYTQVKYDQQQGDLSTVEKLILLQKGHDNLVLLARWLAKIKWL